MKIYEVHDWIHTALTPRYAAGEAKSMARIIMEDAFGIKALKSAATFPASSAEKLKEHILPALLQGQPIQYVLGKALFFGLYFEVNPHVLIPRQETEELVDWALKILKSNPISREKHVLDIGTGSGCIPISMAKRSKNVSVTAVDISLEALSLAQKNADMHGAPVHFQAIDILDQQQWNQVGSTSFDLIVSNPPYIPQQESTQMPAHVLDWEPHLALFVDDEDPCLFYRVIADFASKKLVEGGILLLEINEFRAEAVIQILKDRHFMNIELRPDVSGADRMISAQRPAASTYWEQRWKMGETGWDLKAASPPLCAYIDQIETGKRHLPILVPGCGNGYEALYLLASGFSDIHLLDIAPTAIEHLRTRLNKQFPDWPTKLQLHETDFFQFEGQFHVVLEQTFFCALDPTLRSSYFKKMHDLITPGGRLAGLWFNKEFQGGPPFGGSEAAYRPLFSPYFEAKVAAPCYNSIPPRAGSELFMVLIPKSKDE